MTTYLEAEDLVCLARDMGYGRIRDIGALAVAAQRPQVNVYGEEAYPTVDLKAAALLQSIATARALNRGNRPLAWYATTILIHLNGSQIGIAGEAAIALMESVATGEIHDVYEIAERLDVSPRLRPSRPGAPRRS